MIDINAKIFAQIQNDAFIKGMPELKGSTVNIVAAYLSQYLADLRANRESYPPAYDVIINNTVGIGALVRRLDAITTLTSPEFSNITQEMGTKVLNLAEGESVFLPGGWRAEISGHAMIYQFTRLKKGGYQFTVFNSGGGIRYHAKKSTHEKELYNPAKTWHFSVPTTPKEQSELNNFIGRLLKPSLNPKLIKRKMDAKIIYEEVLPSINHIGGIEVDLSASLPDDSSYTGSQLSGTCAQRSLHQALKTNAISPESYQRFIFKFKHYALEKYIEACFNGRCPFTPAVADQIHLAIENNLKILNKPHVFSSEEKAEYLGKLRSFKEMLNGQVLVTTPPVKNAEILAPLAITEPTMQAPQIPYNINPWVILPKEVALGDGLHFLDNLGKAISCINAYTSLEKCILALPLHEDGFLKHAFYNEIKTLDDLIAFKQKLTELINLLIKHARPQTPTTNVMYLTLMSLLSDAENAIAEKKELPSFKPYTDSIIGTFLNNQIRNPAYATNHPEMDRKFTCLQKRYRKVEYQIEPSAFHDYLKKILEKEKWSALNAALISSYQANYGSNDTELHTYIKKQGLEALYMITEKIPPSTEPQYTEMMHALNEHIKYEMTFMQLVAPFLKNKWSSHYIFKFSKLHDAYHLLTTLYPTWLPYQEQSTTLLEQKYASKALPVLEALKTDMSFKSPYHEPITPPTANYIQLHAQKGGDISIQPVTQADITMRDYFILRSEPSLQISLTLDYFTRNLEKLSDESTQRYLEANLFQPGLLLEAQQHQDFLVQFDRLLSKGLLYYMPNKQPTRESVLFIRLNYLVNRYLTLDKNEQGLIRLKEMQQTIQKQLGLSNEPDIEYVLQQYLFLTLMTQLESGGEAEALFAPALAAYFYLKAHTNPLILEDTTHSAHVNQAMNAFQAIIDKQPSDQIEKALNGIVRNTPRIAASLNLIDANTPYILSANPQNKATFELMDPQKKCRFEIDVFTGNIFKDCFAISGVPLVIQNHPLIKQLGLENIHECLMSQDQTYMILQMVTGKEVHLKYENDQLTVQAEGLMKNPKQRYLLHPLTPHHLAAYANKKMQVVQATLPKILTDGSMNYWTSPKPAASLLTQNNTPRYAIQNNQFYLLDRDGNQTQYALVVPSQSLLQSFESIQFTLAHQAPKKQLIQLPRYNLTFKLDNKDQTLIYTKTGEEVVERPSVIHPSVAGLTLQKGEHSRLIVPVHRFYSTPEEGDPSGFKPVKHDTQGVIAEACLEQHWKSMPPKEQPQWYYQGSERFVSFQVKEGEPIPNNVADALYLAYMYLATNQPEKAWKTLENCRTRFGGLTGDPAELQFITWICQEMPHILPSEEKRPDVRATPPYVACQLKAASLLSDYLLNDGTFDLKKPKTVLNSANEQYVKIEQAQLTDFLKTLPNIIYKKYSRYQRMSRHSEYQYQLDSLERRRLFDYYHQDDRPALGALGYEWMSLTLEAIEQERDELIAQEKTRALSKSDQKRLSQIQKYLASLKPVLAQSTKLELVAINLSLPQNIKINQERLEQGTQGILESWQKDLPLEPLPKAELRGHVSELSSEMSEHELINNFPAYFQIACSLHQSRSFTNALKNSVRSVFGQSQPKLTHADRQKLLLDFCTKTLFANRHIPLADQRSSHALLCNILYRILTNQREITKFLKSATRPISLNEIIKTVGTYHVPPLKVYQAQDVYEEILAKPDDIIAKKKRLPQVQLKSTITAPISTLQQINLDDQKITSLVLAYQAAQASNEQAIADLGAQLDIEIEGQSKEEKFKHAFAIEEQAGLQLFSTEQQQKVYAKQLLEDQNLLTTVLNATSKRNTELEQAIEQAWIAALALANRGPADANLAQTWQIERLAKARATLGKADLIALYCRATAARTIQDTGLSVEEAQQLHDLIHTALVKGIEKQTTEKIITKLTIAKETMNVDGATQALELLSSPGIAELDKPAIVVIQHEEQILLRPRQISALKTLLQQNEDGKPFTETIAKITMGGGKSKVMLPILAEKKAQGHNLVVIEVPQALLMTNYMDLNSVSQRLFGKKAYRLEYTRNSNSSPKSLERMYNQLIEVMSTRSYLVTTAESVQSLELKYLELLMADDEANPTREQQIYWLDKITSLFRNNGDCLIDEVHQSLAINKSLNYTSGETKPINPALIKRATEFFSLIEQEFIKEAPTLSLDFDWDGFQNQVAHSLIEQSGSPMRSFCLNAIKRYGPDVQQQLFNYLTDSVVDLPDVVSYATAEEKDMLAFCKQEVTVLLKQTLTRKVDAHYGASQLATNAPLARTLAIPYAASNTPNERSRFGNELEAINYTTQMMLLNGINKELLINKMSEWITAARQEILQEKVPTLLDQTPTARGFALLTGGLKLSQMDLANDTQMLAIHENLKFNRTLIFDLLKDQVLGQIKQDSTIIHSDAFNHVDLYRTVQGVSGTPSNYSTYHQRLSYDKTASLGSDGYIMQMLHHKESAVAYVDYQSMSTYLNTTLNNVNTRAIIDINATFKGATNLGTAQEIAQFIRQNPTRFSHSVKHVLYFNEEQILCAIHIDKPQEMIPIGTSNEDDIKRILGSDPEERFTYYDQAHTLGTDIKQAPNSHALVLADEKMPLQAFLQGCMRMRELSSGQSIEIIVPERIKGITREDLIKQLAKNEREELLKDNLFAAKARMVNMIRRNLLSHLQDLPSEDVKIKSQLAQHFKSFFLKIPSTNLFALYGAVHTAKATTDILNQNKDLLFKEWQACLNSAGIELKDNEISQMSSDLEGIIKKSLPNCLEEYEEGVSDTSLQVETQKEVHQHTLETKALSECYPPTWREVAYQSWQLKNETEVKQLFCEKNASALTLNEVCECKDMKPLSLFSPELLTSMNYAKTYTGQKEYVGAFLKPVFLIWYYLDDAGILRAMIVTPQEAQELKSNTAWKWSNSWLSTTDDTLVAGNRPNGIVLEERYQALREQIRFFNGELGSLLTQETPLLWVKDETAKKMDFFENHLMQYRPDSVRHYGQFKNSLLQTKMEGFLHIESHAFADLTAIDWRAVLPDATPTEVADYQRVADVFQYLNKHWRTTSLSFEDVNRKFNIPLKGLTYVDNHINKLISVKLLFSKVQNLSAEKPLLLDLNDKEKEALEPLLGMSLTHLYGQFGIQDIAPTSSAEMTKWEMASIHAILLLREFDGIDSLAKDIDAYLVSLINQTASSDVLAKILTLENPPTSICEAMIKKLCNSQEMFTFDDLEYIVKNPSYANAMRNMIKEGRLNATPRIELKILHTFGEKFLPMLSLPTMIEHATADDLGMLVGLETAFSQENLLALAKKVTNKEQIDALLSRAEMNAAIADELFQKASFSNEIKNWPWLTKPHLMQVLKKTSDYESLRCAINHDLMSKTLRDWILDETKIQRDLEKQVKTFSSESLRAALGKLKLKSYEFAIKAKTDPDRYADAAKVSYNLYQTLQDKTEAYLAEEITPNEYLTYCNDEINQARGTLEPHRGYKQILEDILNVVYALVTLRIHKENWRTIKLNTNSMHIVQVFKKRLPKEELPPKDNPVPAHD